MYHLFSLQKKLLDQGTETAAREELGMSLVNVMFHETQELSTLDPAGAQLAGT